MSFDYLGLSDGVLSAIKDSGYTDPTPIQAKAIPSTLQGRDILGIAQTGTGKTASFTLPMIDILSEGRARARMPRSLILEPTRELAAQVGESFEKYGKNSKLSMALLIGGGAFADQVRLLDRGVDVLVATPGRLLDHMERGNVMLNGVEILVVDEADRMLDMGFIPDVEKICKAMPRKLQSLFFSATMPKEVKRLTDKFLKDPKEIQVSSPSSTAANVEQYLARADNNDKAKREALRHLLRQSDIKNAIIFCNRKIEVKLVAKSLKVHGFDVAELHGDMHQSSRMEVLGNFRDGKIQLLVASDVAARGLDIPDVSHVFNFDVPHNPEDYVHRVGRTGRAGRQGYAYTLHSSRDKKYIDALIAFLGREINIYKMPGSTEKPKKSNKTDSSRNTKPENTKKTPEAAPQKKSPPKEERANKADKADVVGMGNHVPAFLMRDA